MYVHLLSKNLLITAWLLLFSLKILAQSNVVSVKTLGRQDNLTDRTVTDIVTDKNGFLWIGTRNGLNRYDGIRVQPYDNRNRTKFRVHGQDVEQLASLPGGMLAIQYVNNRAFIDLLSDGKPEADILFLNTENGVMDADIEDVTLDPRTGDVYLLLMQDSLLYIQELDSTLTFSTPICLQGYEVKLKSSEFRFERLRGGGFIVNDNNIGLLTCNRSGTVDWIQTYDSMRVESGQFASFMQQDRRGRRWLAFEDHPGIWEFNEAAEFYTPFIGLSQTHQYGNLWEDDLGNVVVSQTTAGGEEQLFLIGKNDVVLPYSSFVTNPGDVKVLFSRDFERINYVGTSEGLEITELKKDVVDILGHRDSTSNSIEVNVRGVVTTAEGSVFVLDDRSNVYRPMLNLDSLVKVHPSGDSIDPSHTTTSLVYDRGRNWLWYGKINDSLRSHLVSINVSTGESSEYFFPAQIRDVAIRQDGSIYIVSGTNAEDSRLSSLDLETSVFYYYYLPDGRNPVANHLPTCLLETSDRSIWIGTTDGLLRIDDDENMVVLTADPSDYYGLSNDDIRCLQEFRTGGVLVGTYGGGLNVYDPLREQFVYYDERDGLGDDRILSLVQESTDVWVGTERGISYLNSSLNIFRAFGKPDGFEYRSFNENAACIDSTGMVYFGSESGLNAFRPPDLLGSEIDAPVLLLEVSYFDRQSRKIVRRRHLNPGEIIELPAQNRYLQCVFSMADYANSGHHRYRYKLVGRDEEWNNLGKVNEVRFDDLASGNYTLIVEGIDRNGHVSEQSLQVPVQVDNFLYQKWWFILACIVFASLLGYIIHRIRLQQAVRLERLRTKISSDLHDDVGGLLSGLAMQTEILEYSARERDKPKLQRIAHMSRNAMAQMRDVIWATDARKDRFEDLLERTKEYAAEILFSRSIEFYFHVQNINTERKIPVTVRQNLYLILKESLTNIAKHSQATRVDIYMRKVNNEFELEVRNNSREPVEKVSTGGRKGSGLDNMKMRAKSIGAVLEIDHENQYQMKLNMRSFV